MKNKVLVDILVPSIEEIYDVYLPVNKKIGIIIILLSRAISEFTNVVYSGDETVCLYNNITGEKYNIDAVLRVTDIRNGSTLVLM